MRAAGAPPHLLFLDHAFADDLVDRGFHERGGDGLAGESAFPVVRDGAGVGGEVAAELADRLGLSLVTVSGRFWSIYLACLVDLFGRSAVRRVLRQQRIDDRVEIARMFENHAIYL